MKPVFLLLLAVSFSNLLLSQQQINLYTSEEWKTNGQPMPCSKTENKVAGNDGNSRISNVTEPVLEAFIPQKENANRAAVIICPGGGYAILSIDKEGYNVAKALNEMGITAFVLKYRLPDPECMQSPHNKPLMDAQQAIKYVRLNAAKYRVDTNKIGILGFSAGGHLAATAGTHFNKPAIASNTPLLVRPDFMVLLYPVISFTDSITHKGSKTRLLGSNYTGELEYVYTNEKQVTANTPKTFLVHASDDKAVPAANSLRFAEALIQHNIPVELHLYPAGGHGFGMNNATTPDKWMDRLKNWLLANKIIN